MSIVVDTFINMAYAFAWPLWVIQWQSPWGLVLLLVAVILFPRYVKPQLEQWLLGGFVSDESAEEKDPSG